RRAFRPVFRRAQALSERRLLQRHHHARHRHPDEHVHGDLRDRAFARVDRALARGPARRFAHRSPTAGLRRPGRARVRAARRPRLTRAVAPRGRRNLMGSAGLAPLAKTGGLADAVAGPSATLGGEGHDVRVLIPAYAASASERGGATIIDGAGFTVALEK